LATSPAEIIFLEIIEPIGDTLENIMTVNEDNNDLEKRDDVSNIDTMFCNDNKDDHKLNWVAQGPYLTRIVVIPLGTIDESRLKSLYQDGEIQRTLFGIIYVVQLHGIPVSNYCQSKSSYNHSCDSCWQ
jgi:hypothetical protein